MPSPVPVAASYSTGTTLLTLTFDRPLEPGNITDDNIRLSSSVAGQRKATAQAHAGGTTLVLATATRAGIGVDPPTTRYLATPAELIGPLGQAVAAYTSFPLTITA